MRKYIYADESGDFNFSLHPSASRYFTLTTVALQDFSVANDLIALRRDLVWIGDGLHREFHATEDAQAVRDRVFEILSGHDFRVDATLLEKRKARPQTRPNEPRFYKYAWFFHMRHVAPSVTSKDDELLVVAASIGTKKEQVRFQAAIEDVMAQTSPTIATKTVTCPVAVETCLQIADYCSWAIQRKWEKGDNRSYDLIRSKIESEFDLFKTGRSYYY